MDSDPLRGVRSRYKAAYDAYAECAERTARKLCGPGLSNEDLAAEAQAMERLAAARRDWLDATAISVLVAVATAAASHQEKTGS